MTNFRNPPLRDRAYLDHLRTRPCIVTLRGDTEPAHLRLLGSGGMGKKPNDNRVLPLHWELHRQQSTNGEGKCWLRWTREYPEFVPRMAERYPDLWFRFLISVAEAEHENWRRIARG